MNYKECKEKYNTYIKCLQTKKDELQKKDQEIKEACGEYDEVSSIWVSAKEKLEDAQNKLESYTKKKISKLNVKLIGILAFLGIGIEIIVACSFNFGYLYALLCAATVILTTGTVYLIYTAIKELKPEWIQHFWKQDKNFIELKGQVKTKEKELDIAESNRNNVSNRVLKLRKKIKNIEENISYIEHDILELMLAFAPTLFDGEVDEQDKTYEKSYTRIRRLEN